MKANLVPEKGYGVLACPETLKVGAMKLRLGSALGGMVDM
jgi:hypothetical protein